MRKTYGDLFKRLPKLRCDLGSRIVEGAFVIDHEICSIGGPDQMRAVAIYQVENGLIRRVWFTPAD